jgi:hypothetical protein
LQFFTRFCPVFGCFRAKNVSLRVSFFTPNTPEISRFQQNMKPFRSLSFPDRQLLWYNLNMSKRTAGAAFAVVAPAKSGSSGGQFLVFLPANSPNS